MSVLLVSALLVSSLNQAEPIDQLAVESSQEMSYASSQQTSANIQKDNTKKCPKHECKEKNFEIFGDLLYFKAYEDGLRYAEQFVDPSQNYSYYKEIEQPFSYELAFRLGFTFPIQCDDWSISANWMYYNPTMSSVNKGNANSFDMLAGLVIPSAFTDEFNQATESVKGKWALSINSVDVTVNKIFHPVRHWSLTPYAGIKWGLIDQHINVRYGVFATSPNIYDAPPRTVKCLNKMNGIGPLLGFRVLYEFVNHWGIDINGAFSFLYDRFKMRTRYDNFTFSDGSVANFVQDLKRTIHRISFFDQLQISLNKKWVCDSVDVHMMLGWEIQVWTQQLHLDWLSTLPNQLVGDDLTLSGPFFRFGICF